MDRESCFSIGIDDAQPGQHLNQLFNAMTLFLYTAKKNLHCSLVAMQLRLWNVCLLNEIRVTAGNVRALLFVNVFFILFLIPFRAFSILYLLDSNAQAFFPSNMLLSMD